MQQQERVGFIGLGNMGGAIALRLLRAGYPLTVLDLDEARMKPLIQEGAGAASSPRRIAETSTIVFASLQSDAVEKVACGEDGILHGARDGLAFVDLSSTPPELAVRLAQKLKTKGVAMLDAPVSGADIGATNGNLTVFAGGEYETYRRCLPVLQHVGRTVTHLGPSGNGQIGKRVNQMMQSMSELAIYEGLSLAKELGLDPMMFARAAAGGCAQSWRLDELVDAVFNKGEKNYRLRLRPGRTRVALEMAESVGLKLPGAEAAHRVFGEHDWNIVIDGEK